MEEFFEPGRFAAEFQSVVEWTLHHITNIWTLLQVVLLVLLFGLSAYLGKHARPALSSRLDRINIPARVASQIRVLPTVLTPLIYLLLLGTAILVIQQLTWPSRSYLLGIATNLLTAWIVIRLVTTFVNNPALAKTLAFCAWTVAALNITELLDPTVALLDSLAVSFGDLRISLLTIVKGMLTLALLLWAASALSRFLERRINQVPDLTPSVQVLLGKLLKITLISLAVVIAINSVGIDLTALAVFSGAVGVGIGFGLQKVVSNLISGVILLLDKSIKPGDVIELGETFGWISSLGARYVSVVTRDSKEYLIPNEDLITQRVVNWSFSDKLIRMEITFGVSYDCDPHEVRRIAREAASNPDRVVSERPPVCHLTGFGDSSLDFVLRFWIKDPSGGVANIKGEVLLALWDAFKEHDIEIPYPHNQIIVKDPIVVESRNRPTEA
ncbi:mechanosensitive ion channel family protein [Pelagibius sp. Alg239-R121]|uniref:mechanosensitive ion channel family protein n=1 Tax=Pelagibius sp. Alg239-R121 TaxID=2993448 RepID=UPI0024A64762|nr:mechanosensitive ion channel domain-containing protein [Pelagibius sp. Alg239-R121]